MDVHEIGHTQKEKLMSFLSNKPIWAYWIAYSVLTAVFFGIFYTATYLLALKWWVAAIVILAIGVIWGSFAFAKSRPKEEENKAEKPV